MAKYKNKIDFILDMITSSTKRSALSGVEALARMQGRVDRAKTAEERMFLTRAKKALVHKTNARWAKEWRNKDWSRLPERERSMISRALAKVRGKSVSEKVAHGAR